MNINPKKSWHVRNKDNVAKVRKDEENARLAEVEQTRRAALAEQEARTNFLRQKARNKTLKTDGATSISIENGSSEKSIAPLNFFSDSSLERGATSRIKNAENEKEKKEEQVDYERKIGLLTFLGESAAERKGEAEQPWWMSNKRKLSAEEKDLEKDAKRKCSIDPLQSMKEYVEKKKEHVTNKEKKHKRHKHKNRKEVEERIPRSANKNDKLAKLREERLKREKKERERAMILLNGDSKKDNDGYSAPGKYHSQFNPHLVRNRTRH